MVLLVVVVPYHQHRQPCLRRVMSPIEALQLTSEDNELLVVHRYSSSARVRQDTNNVPSPLKEAER